MFENISSGVHGHIEIRDAVTQEVLVSKPNAIHYENFSEALAMSLANRTTGHIQEMVFGNGASSVSGIGAITYFPPNTTGQDAKLYNETYSKVVDDASPLNADGGANFLTVQHKLNATYSDIIVTCYLGYSEPTGQDAFDDATDMDGNFVFDEIGLRSFDPTPNNGKLLTHVIFHPVQKSLNRTIEIVYTLRIYMN